MMILDCHDKLLLAYLTDHDTGGTSTTLHGLLKQRLHFSLVLFTEIAAYPAGNLHHLSLVNGSR